jgi:hypothetical protein
MRSTASPSDRNPSNEPRRSPIGPPGRYQLRRGPFSDHPEIQQVVPVDAMPRLFESAADWSHLQWDTSSPKVVLFDLRPGDIGDTEAAGIIESLSEVGTQCWVWLNHRPESFLLTKCQQAATRVRTTVFLAAMDDRTQKALDPHGSDPTERIATMATLVEHGISVNAAIDPLLPGVTDTRETLSLIVDAVSRAGVQRIITGYLTLPESERGRIEDALLSLGVLDTVLDAFVDGPIVKEYGESIRLLPKTWRHRGYALLMSLAAERGLSVRVSSLSNPDFRTVPVQPIVASRSLQETFRSRFRSRLPHRV